MVKITIICIIKKQSIRIYKMNNKFISTINIYISISAITKLFNDDIESKKLNVFVMEFSTKEFGELVLQ